MFYLFEYIRPHQSVQPKKLKKMEESKYILVYPILKFYSLFLKHSYE